jgi:hypothetical protein
LPTPPPKLIEEKGKVFSFSPLLPRWAAPLRFTPYAWMKILFFCGAGKKHADGNTEVGGFGVTAKDDPFLVEDFFTVKQENYSFFVKFDDESVANFFEDQVVLGKHPSQFGRVWLHTHPGSSPLPSGKDEQTFVNSFGSCDQAVMFIMAENGPVYARLRKDTNDPLVDEFLLNVEIQFDAGYRNLEPEEWAKEFSANIHPMVWSAVGGAEEAEQSWSSYYGEYDPEELGLEQWLPKRENFSMTFGPARAQEGDISLEPWVLDREELGLSSFSYNGVFCSARLYEKLLALAKACRKEGAADAFDNAVYDMLESMESAALRSVLPFEQPFEFCIICAEGLEPLWLCAVAEQDEVLIDFADPVPERAE